MIQSNTLYAIPLVFVLIFAFGSLPSADAADSKSTINVKPDLTTGIIGDAGGDAIGIIGDAAVDTACEDGLSQNCSFVTLSSDTLKILLSVFLTTLSIVTIIGIGTFIIKSYF